MLRHLAHEIAEALGVVVVERRVDLVEQAERRRVQLEHREHERERGERLLAAREQMDRGVLLARRLRDHLHAAVEDLLAGQHEPRVAAAEERREHLAEMRRSPRRTSPAAARASRGRCAGSRLRASPSPRSGPATARRDSLLRSCAVCSSSSAARLTAPSALISSVRRAISACSAPERVPFSSTLCERASSAPASASCCAYCSSVSRASCSFSRTSFTRSRSGSEALLGARDAPARRPSRASPCLRARRAPARAPARARCACASACWSCACHWRFVAAARAPASSSARARRERRGLLGQHADRVLDLRDLRLGALRDWYSASWCACCARCERFALQREHRIGAAGRARSRARAARALPRFRARAALVARGGFLAVRGLGLDVLRDLGELERDLLAALREPLRLLGQAQRFDLERVMALLRLADASRAASASCGLVLGRSPLRPPRLRSAPRGTRCRARPRASLRAASISRWRDSTPCSSESGAWKLTLWRV